LRRKADRLVFWFAPLTLAELADVAQLVEHHLAKVRVAGSNPVVRSERVSADRSNGGVAERRGNGLQIRLHGFKSRLHLAAEDEGDWRSGSALP